ncbi:SDR family NAD(P)-dependent oxidoreductase [Seongchinamella sediminis]|uniref:SDR family NAD(P)-dependent oxidoreductase n=1 Tax=Seongchinamella sediminis TaxID=2283635 RepID=A0A3L7DV15_9GAMM|nr:SDR family NAD(P)-dependent oxidoreductase [Seongchinamella sediminis]RLQ20625.1 SDR family NAD(P)-dependent oxidoreductase [Seongchinamella sediminis]
MAYTAGKCAVVTGAGSGIGRALALQLNREGCALYLSDIKPGSLDATAALLERADPHSDLQVLDVADRDAVEAWARRIAGERGQVDIVINNAGVALAGSSEENSYEDIQWLMNINFWGVVHGSRAFLPLLRKSPQGHLVNISSVFGMISVPTQSAYNASKFAVRGYTESLRMELADSNVHVCCVHPGGISTNIARDSRGGEASPEDRDARFQAMTRTSAESAAAQIISAVAKRRKRLLVGPDAKYIALITRLAPVNYMRLLAPFLKDALDGAR